MITSEKMTNTIPAASFDVCEAGRRGRSGSRTCRIGRELRIDLDKLSRFCLVDLNPIEDDLLLLAGAVAFADKSLSRRPSLVWRRNIQLIVPVSDPDRWKAPALYRKLICALDYVTGDCWEILFKKRLALTRITPQLRFDIATEDALVMPFSDGLDSFAVARLVASDHPTTPLILVTTGRHKNKALDGSTVACSPNVRRIAVPFTLSSRFWRVRFREHSYRSRAFAFGVVAGIAAHQLRARRICIPESGQGTLGPWLSPVGNEAPDVRTHPSFTMKLSEFLTELFGSSITHVHPRLWHTKGETLSELNGRGLAEEWWRTWSCSRDERHVSLDHRRIQCGICGGCILRRQSLHAAHMHHEADEYLWSDISATTLDQSTKQRPTNRNDECQAQCAVLDMERFGKLAENPRKVEIAAEELAPYVGVDADIAAARIHRLLRAHADEWSAFRSTNGPQSFLNRWLEILQ